MVREGQTGFCFPPGDEAALAATLKRVAGLSDMEVFRLGEQSRSWVETEFSVARYVERVTALYRELGAA